MVQSILGSVLTLALGGCGLYFFLRGGYVFLRHPSLLIRRQDKPCPAPEREGISPFGALCVALGGTIGVGNTVGVASALLIGGPGALFWMWVSALGGMALKYAEVTLSHRYRTKRGGGAMILLKRLKKPVLARVFALACLAVSLGMGNLAQVGAAAAALQDACAVTPLVTGGVTALICLFLFFGGTRRLERFCTLCVPVASLLFFALCARTLYQNAACLPRAVGAVFCDAFSLRSAAGGMGGALFLRGVTSGFARGIFSNEAGLGSAPLIHAEAKGNAVTQGIWGAREVVLDTHIVCTLSALCILSSPVFWERSAAEKDLCSAVFSRALGSFGATLFAVSLAIFAVASIVAWGHYGLRALAFLTTKKSRRFLYVFLFFCTTLLGAICDFSAVLLLSDFANACMALPNLYAVWRLRKDVVFPRKTCNYLQFVHNSTLSYGKIGGDEGE